MPVRLTTYPGAMLRRFPVDTDVRFSNGLLYVDPVDPRPKPTPNCSSDLALGVQSLPLSQNAVVWPLLSVSFVAINTGNCAVAPSVPVPLLPVLYRPRFNV